MHDGPCTESFGIKVAELKAGVARRGGSDQAAWQAFYEKQERAHVTRQADLQRDLTQAWTTYLLSGGKG